MSELERKIESKLGELMDLIREIVREELRTAQAEIARDANGSRLITVAEYAATHSVAQSTVRRWLRERRLEKHQLGRSVRIAADATVDGQVDVNRRDAVADRARKALGITDLRRNRLDPCVRRQRG